MVLMVAAVLGAEVVTLAWDESPEGSVIGYRLYAGTNSRAYFIVSNVVGRGNTTGRIEVPFPAVWHFAVTATNAAGLESDYSAEVVYPMTLPAPQLVAESYVRLTPRAERSTNRTEWAELWLEPTLLPATNAQEFFRVTGLEIEPIKMLKP
jgi:hypothetical protein